MSDTIAIAMWAAYLTSLPPRMRESHEEFSRVGYFDVFEFGKRLNENVANQCKANYLDLRVARPPTVKHCSSVVATTRDVDLLAYNHQPKSWWTQLADLSQSLERKSVHNVGVVGKARLLEKANNAYGSDVSKLSDVDPEHFPYFMKHKGGGLVATAYNAIHTTLHDALFCVLIDLNVTQLLENEFAAPSHLERVVSQRVANYFQRTHRRSKSETHNYGDRLDTKGLSTLLERSIYIPCPGVICGAVPALLAYADPLSEFLCPEDVTLEYASQLSLMGKLTWH